MAIGQYISPMDAMSYFIQINKRETHTTPRDQRSDFMTASSKLSTTEQLSVSHHPKNSFKIVVVEKNMAWVLGIKPRAQTF
mgnify:CR=1 FL=1